MKKLTNIIAFLFVFCFQQTNAVNKVLKEGINFKRDTIELGEYIQVTTDVPADLLIDAGKTKIRSVEIKPAHLNIQYKIVGNRIRLIGVKPCKVAITINEDYSKPIYLFVNPPHPKSWEKLPENTIRFKKGIHNIDKYTLKGDNVTLFLEDGAVLKGNIWGEHVKNVKILGYGVIDGRASNRGIRLEYSTNIEIDGPLVLSKNGWSTSFFECKDLLLKNTKILSSEVFSDGIDLLGTSNVLVDDVFIRNEDDCISIKTKKYKFSGNVENICVQNSVFWSGNRGNALEIGWELDGDYVRNIKFENIDIIRKETSPSKFKRAAISIHHVGSSTISNVLYKDIRIESVFENLIWIELIPAINNMIPANKWGTGGGSIDGVKFENINYLGSEDVPIVINGNDSGKINNVEFKGLIYKQKEIKSISDKLFQIKNSHVVIK